MKKESRSQMMLFLLLAGVCFYLVPEVAVAVIFFIKESSLADWVIILCRVIGVLAGLILMLFAMKSAFQLPEQKSTGLIRRFLIGTVNTVFVYLASDFLLDKLYQLTVKLLYRWLWASISVMIVLTVAALIIQGVAMYLWITKALPMMVEKPVKQLVKKPLTAIFVIALAAVVHLLPNILSWILESLPWSMAMNATSRYLLLLLIALGQAYGLGALLSLVGKAACGMKSSVHVIPEEKTKEIKLKNIRTYPVVMVSAIGIAVIFLIRGIGYYTYDPVDIIGDTIENEAGLGGSKLVQGDIEGGLQDLKDARMMRDMWYAVLGKEGKPSIGSLYGENSIDATLAYLYATKSGDVGVLERYLRVNATEPELCLALLELYEKQGELSDYQKVFRDEAKYVCIVSETYNHSWLSPADLQAHAARLEVRLNEYVMLDEQVELLEVSVDILRNGSATVEIVENALKLAEKYPDNWTAQYLAAIAGSALQYDDARHYEETIAAVQRFEKLYCEAQELNDENLLGLQLKVAQMIINCYGYRQAIPYLEKAIELGGIDQAFSMAAQCYEQLEQYEDCYELCVLRLQSAPDDLAARFYAALCALKTGMRTEALQQTSLLAELARETGTAADYGADVSLFAMIQFITVNDSASWTEYQYAFYPDMDDEQKAVVQQNQFLADYLKAAYYCFSARESDRWDIALEAVDRVLAENENLPQAWYLKGAIHHGRKEFDLAVEAYQKSLNIVPTSATVWFAMANSYDGLGEYRLAYEACERTMQLLPNLDHGADWYGVSYHCQSLMNALKNQLGGGN